MPVNLIARRMELPCDVPLGGVAVLLEDGQIVGEDAVRGPGHLRPRRRLQPSRREAIVLFTTTPTVRLNFDGLNTAEGIELRLFLKLTLEVADPLCFARQVVGSHQQVGEEDLANLLRDAVRSGLTYELRRCSLVDLRSRRPAGWLGTVVEAHLRGEVDLLGRNGLEFVGVEAADLQELGAGEPRKREETDGEREPGGSGREPGQSGEISQGAGQWRESKMGARFWLDRPELDGLWRVLCPRCLSLALDCACSHCGWRRTYGPSSSPLQPVSRVDGHVNSVYGGVSALGNQLCVTTEEGRVVLVGWGDWQEQRGAILEWERERWLPSPQVAGDAEHVYVGCARPETLGASAPLLALRREDLGVAWGLRSTGSRVSSPTLYDGNLYFADSGGLAWAVMTAGEALWRQPLDVSYSPQPPAVDDDLVIFPSRDSRIVALDRCSGEFRWAYEGAVQDAGLPNSPLIVGDRVYVAGWDGYLTCLDRKDGRRPLWRYPAERGQAWLTQPVVAGSLILVGGRDCRLHAVRDLGDRWKLAWIYPVSAKRSVHSRPVVVEDVVYVTGGDGRLHAVDLETGQPLWPEPLELGKGVRAALASDGWHVIAVGVDGAVWMAPRYAPPLGDAAAYAASGRWGLAAAAHIVMGDLLRAAELCLEHLRFPEAALALAKGTSDRNAATALFLRLGRRWEAARLREEWGDWLEAARLWEQEGEVARAMVLYRKEGSRSALEQALAIAQQLVDWRQEAEILAALGRLREAGEAVRAEAERREAETRGRAEEELSQLWELAEGYYREAGLSATEEPRLTCRQKAAYYRREPDLRIAFLPGERPFVVEEINRLRLVIRNLGRGVAREVRVILEPVLDAMEGELAAGPQTIQPLGGEWEASLSVIPNKVGLVKLQCTLEYGEGQRLKRLQQCWEIEVRRPTQADPQVVNFYGGGQFIQSGGDTIVAGGDVLGEGAQKGDRVTIQRRSLAEEARAALARCRRCGWALAVGAAYCENCGEEAPKV